MIGTIDPQARLTGACAGDPGDENAAVRRVLAGARIIFVFSSLELGGAERQAIHLAAFLKNKMGSEVEIWGFSPPGRAAELCREKGIACRSVRPPLCGGTVAKMIGLARFVKELRAARPTVLLPYTMGPNIICGLTWRNSGARVCVWNQRDEGRGRVRKLAEKWAVRRTPLFISNSAHGANFLCSGMGADRNRVFVVKNGIELPPAAVPRQQWQRAHDIPPDHFVACMVAHLHQFKDHETLLRAWAVVVSELQRRGTGATLLLAGRQDGTAQSLGALALQLGIERSVRFLGPVSDVSSMLNAVEVGVLSSRLEGCPNAVLEYMAAPLPVVATDIPGIREALGSQGEECLTPIGDAGAMADRIIRLALDPALRARRARANLERSHQFFGVEGMCWETARLIAGALA